MNNNDRNHIGYLLSDSTCLDEFQERLFEWDEKIRTEYDGYEIVAGRDTEADDLFDRLMVERYGHRWSLLREKPPIKEVLEEARRKVYDDDYDFIFGKGSM